MSIDDEMPQGQVWPAPDEPEQSAESRVPEGLEIAEDWGPDHRSGYVALVGRPNVGKSTLMNAWLGTGLAPVSPKPQTTRTNLLGILTRPDAQLIFVDTPGIHLPRTALGQYMVQEAASSLHDADVILFVADAVHAPDAGDREVALRLADLAPTVILVLNKVDTVSPERLAERWAAYGALGAWSEVMAISATKGTNLDLLLGAVVARLPLGPRYYAQDQLSDVQERQVVAELVRAQALRTLDQEVPHALAVLVDEFKERENGAVYIAATIYAEKESQKGIVIGQGGRTLKAIGAHARREIEAFLGHPVYLELWVKVRRNWRRDPDALRDLGYTPHDPD